MGLGSWVLGLPNENHGSSKVFARGPVATFLKKQVLHCLYQRTLWSQFLAFAFSKCYFATLLRKKVPGFLAFLDFRFFSALEFPFF